MSRMSALFPALLLASLPAAAIAGPAENKAVAVDGMSFFRFADGKIVEEWSTYDNLSILKQLGLIPAK